MLIFLIWLSRLPPESMPVWALAAPGPAGPRGGTALEGLKEDFILFKNISAISSTLDPVAVVRIACITRLKYSTN